MRIPTDMNMTYNVSLALEQPIRLYRLYIIWSLGKTEMNSNRKNVWTFHRWNFYYGHHNYDGSIYFFYCYAEIGVNQFYRGCFVCVWNILSENRFYLVVKCETNNTTVAL